MATPDLIANLSLWLDSTDLSSIQTVGTLCNGISKWLDKSSNAYEFIPLRNQDRPCLSTNAVLFDQVSSFQFISRQKIPATSSLDLYAMVTPYSLWGPFQPFFDSADITLSETDGRFNTQIYADGSEYFKGVPIPSTTQGTAIYKGELYTAQNTGGAITNFLKKWNPISENFDNVGPEYFDGLTQSLCVYRNKLYAACYNGNPAVSSIQMVVYDTDASVLQNVSTVHPYGIRGPVVYNRSLYAVSRYGWYNNRVRNSALFASPTSNGYLYRYNNATQLFTVAANLQYNRADAINNNDYGVNFSNMIAYKGSLYINGSLIQSYSAQFLQYDENTPSNINVTAQGVTDGYLGIYGGNIIVPRNDQRLFKFNAFTFQTFGRCTFNRPNSFVAYKGNLWIMKPASGLTSNTFEIFTGDRGGPFSNAISSNVTTNFVTSNTSNMMIVHDGKLFLKQDSAFYTYVYGNGTSLDQSFSTLVGAPILLNIRRDETSCQMYLNGVPVQSKATNFTFATQAPRQMFVGGAAGTMSGGASDCGSDHFQGAIHSIVEYSRILSEQDRQRVEGILCWQFGTQDTLPDGHPFKFSPP
jgi:hypothetical protein